MGRPTKRQKLLRNNPDWYKQMRAKRTTYKPHSGLFTPETSKRALQARFSRQGGRATAKRRIAYVGYIGMSGDGQYSLHKFDKPFVGRKRPVTNFSNEELEAIGRSTVNKDPAASPAKRTSGGANETGHRLQDGIRRTETKKTE